MASVQKTQKKTALNVVVNLLLGFNVSSKRNNEKKWLALLPLSQGVLGTNPG